MITWLVCISQPPTIQSPQVASVNKFIDVPVDKSTGIPNINIPLYTINQNGFNMPLSVSYHAGGIKVEEQASNIGLGWALNFGGVISRTVKSKADELGGYYTNQGTQQPISPQLFIPPYYPCSTCPLVKGVVQDIVPNYWDTEPDLFYFNVNGLSGKFLFDKNRNAKIIPEQDIKIETDQYFTEFKLTNSDGNIYIFSAIESSSSTDLAANTSITINSAWHLTKVITPSKENIDFTYQNQGASFQKVLPHEPSLSANGGCPVQYLQPYAYSHFSGKAISSVSFKNGKIDFLYQNTLREDYASDNLSSSSMKALETIKITNSATNEIVKQYKFSYSYFLSNVVLSNYSEPEPYIKKRLRLDELTECDGAGNSCIPPYNFFYNKNNTTFNGVFPSRLSNGQDHWGFYNGKDYNVKLYTGLTNCAYNANREPDPLYKAAYILDEIKFPTGGIKSFIYESSTVGGALRVKEINDNSSNSSGAAIQKQYSYYNSTLVGGEPVYAQQIETSDILSLPGGNYTQYEVCDQFYPNMYTYSYVFQSPVNYTGEITPNFVIHGKVNEHIIGRGSIESEFDLSHINDEIDLEQATTYPFIVTAPLLLTGKLIRESYSDENSNLVKEVLYEYGSTRITIVSNPDAYKVVKPLCIQQVRYYDLFTGFAYLSKKIERNFDNTGLNNIETTTDYEYGGLQSSTSRHLFVTKESTTLNNGEVLITRLKYPMDYKAEIGTITGGETWDNTSKGINEAIKQNIINVPVESVSSRLKNGVELVINGTLNKFISRINNQNKTLVSVDNISKLNLLPTSLYNSQFLSKITKNGNSFQFSNHANYSVEGLFENYDDVSNVLNVKKVDGISSVYVWGYNKQYPVARVIGAGYLQVISLINQGILDNPLSTDIQIRNELNSLRNGLSNTNALVTTYTYKPLVGMTSETDPNGKTIYYEYDNFNRLALIRDKDNNILKKICYNYAGQVENCLSPCPPNSPPNWQNTTTALRCQQSCGNTGYQEQEQKDMNPCSATYNQTQWVVAGYNPTACSIPTCIALTSTNIYSMAGYTASYYNTSTGITYPFAVPAVSGLQPLGSIPAGTYHLTITRSGTNLYGTFWSGCNFQTITGSTPVVFNNITVGSKCHSITLDLGN